MDNILKRQKWRSKMRELGRVRRRKIKIQKMTMGRDEWQNEVKYWADWREVWAERSSLWGQAYYAAKAVNEENTVEFVLRYVGFLDELNTFDYQVVFEGVAYEIEQIDHLDDDGMWIKLRCLERGVNENSSN